jgi:tetratricopeptide (TPR) repeat protein
MDEYRTEDRLERAIALHESGRLADAEAAYLQILDVDPNQPDALNLLGVILQNRGEFARSIELISRALEIDADFPEALTNLARAQCAFGQPQRAVDAARRAMALDTELPVAPLILCRALLELKDFPAACVAGGQATGLAPESCEAHALLGQALSGWGDWTESAACYQVALDLKPAQTAVRVKLAAALTEGGHYEPAIAHLRQAATEAPNAFPYHAALGVALRRSQDVRGSMAAFQRALELSSNWPEVWRMQGENFDALGRFDDAAICYRRSLELEPSSAATRRNLAEIGRLDDESTQIARLGEVLVNADVPATDRIAAGFALGTLFDRSAAYDRAFHAFDTANKLARIDYAQKGEVFEADAVRKDVDARIAQFSHAALAMARLKGDLSEQPVFVVGMPRSGTTLIEQIAASHKRVHGVGETLDIPKIVTRLEPLQPGVPSALWDAEMVRREAAAHLARLRLVAGDVDRVVDKLPDNALRLGQIATLFPRARVIICRRDLRDVCLSSYFQSFDEPTPWSLDLLDCGIRTREIARLLDHWIDVQPVRILEMHYEHLVGDLEGQSRRLIDFLGLDWDPACLDFHKTQRQVLSASQWQVRQPLYSSSVGRWRHYRQHLGPLFKGLGDRVRDEASAL